MKRLYRIAFSLLTLGLVTGSSFSQCDIDNNCSSLICPSPTDVSAIPVAEEATDYTLNFTINVPSDTTVVFGPTTVSGTINYLTVTSIEGLPSSLTKGCSSGDCKILGGTRGCFNISGTPVVGEAGSYDLTINLTTNYTVAGISSDYVASFAYTLTVTENTDGGVINSLKRTNKDHIQIYPNPATDILSFNTEGMLGQYELINSQGLIVISGQLNDDNLIKTSEFDPGTYFLHVTTDYKVVTEKVLLR
jgi:hypothetical protein